MDITSVVERHQSGDAGAMCDAISLYQPVMNWNSSRFLVSPTGWFAREDLLSIQMWALWRAMETCDPRHDAVDSYCKRTMHNACVDAIRGLNSRRKREQLLDRRLVYQQELSTVTVEDLAIGNISVRRVAQIHRSLPPRYKQVISLRMHMGLVETARVMGITVGATKAMQHAARRKFAAALASGHVRGD